MAKAPAFQYYAKDHIATKASLSMEERGAWSTLVDHCWENGAPISMSLAVRLVGEKQIESLRFLLRIEGDTVTLDWIEETRTRQAERSQTNSENGRKGGRGKTRSRKNKSERKANAYRKENELKPFRAADAVEDVVEGGLEKERASDPHFEALWKAFDGYGAKAKAFDYWQRLTLEDRAVILDKAGPYCESTPGCKFRKQLEGWINPANRLWERPIVAREATTVKDNAQRRDLKTTW